MKEKNACLTATKNEKGFITLSLTLKGAENISIRVNDFGGKDKKKARKIAYKLYCLCNGVK